MRTVRSPFPAFFMAFCRIRIGLVKLPDTAKVTVEMISMDTRQRTRKVLSKRLDRAVRFLYDVVARIVQPLSDSVLLTKICVSPFNRIFPCASLRAAKAEIAA